MDPASFGSTPGHREQDLKTSRPQDLENHRWRRVQPQLIHTSLTEASVHQRHLPIVKYLHQTALHRPAPVAQSRAAMFFDETAMGVSCG